MITMPNFTFNHTSQIDKLYSVMSSTQVKTKFDSRGNEIRDFLNNTVVPGINTSDANLVTHKTSADHDGRYYTEAEIDSKVATLNTPVTTITNGMMLSTDKSKLDGIATGANNYVHPANHPPSIITQDASNRFVTDTEKANWNSKAPLRKAINTVTTNTTLALTDANTRLIANSGTALTITIPLNSAVAFTIGDEIEIFQYGLGAVTIAGPGVTINSKGGNKVIDGQFANARLLKVATDEWLLTGLLKV